MEQYVERICYKCSPKGIALETNHELKIVRDMVVDRCCNCHFLTYYKEDGKTEIPKEEVFAAYPDLLEEKKKLLVTLRRTRCAKCSSSGNPDDMWCWNLPWCKCDVKTLREEIEGVCKNPLSAKEFIDKLSGV